MKKIVTIGLICALFLAGCGNKVDPELKEALDSYESYVDKCVDMVNQYKANPLDLSILSNYKELYSEATELEGKADKLYEDQSNWSNADKEYYKEVMDRCSKKMAGTYIGTSEE